MAYRKTEKVLAELEAVRTAIVASAIDVIRKAGLAGLTMEAVKARAGCSVGSLYNRFPDLTELTAAITTQLLARDLEAMRAAVAASKDSVAALASALSVFYARLESPNLLRMLLDQPAYRLGLRGEVETLLRLIGGSTPKDRAMTAAATLGAIAGLVDVLDGSENKAPAALLLALRTAGIGEAAARKAVERRYSMA